MHTKTTLVTSHNVIKSSQTAPGTVHQFLTQTSLSWVQTA